MRTLRLRTIHNCYQLPCPTCSTVETAFRRALGLAGYPLPENNRRGRRSEAYLSGEIAIEIIHDCDNGASVPHFECLVDDVMLPLPRGGSARRLQEEFAGVIERLQPASTPGT